MKNIRNINRVVKLSILFLVGILYTDGVFAQRVTWPSAISTFTGGGTYCQNDPAGNLSVSFSTCVDGASGPLQNGTITVTWYSNTTNATTGGTQVAQTISNAGTTTYTYTPSTISIGTLYYYAVITWTNTGNACGNNSPLSTSTFTPSTQVVVVNPPPPAQPGPVTGLTLVDPSTGGLVYSISPVTDATSYTWSVPTGWSINSGQGTTSVSVTSGIEGQNGNITVTASNSCGTSGASSYPVIVSAAAISPTITLGPYPAVCEGTISADLPYTATTGTPDQYSIDYFAASEAAGFSDVVNAILTSSPISLTVPAGAPAGIYYGNLTVRNTTSGLSSGNYNIWVKVLPVPATPGSIFGNSTVPESTPGLSYGIIAVDDASTYIWTVPTGWTITSGQGTTSIVVTSGAAGQNGNVSVMAENSCGTSSASILAVVSETPLDHSLYGCNACHITHTSPGNTLTSTLGNANLCMSCHTATGAASSKPFENADKAIPGVSGTSHAWDVPSVNATYETQLTGDPDMLLRVDAGNITCSVCHNQHNSNTNLNYTRISNAGDVMCKDCHAPRNVGRFADDNVNNRGSHPVGLDYPGTGDFETTPTGSVVLVGGKIECSSCHQTHYAPTNDGTLLRQTNDNILCTSCHTLGLHNGMNCLDCHLPHNPNKQNIYMIRDTITTPNSGIKTVIFSALTGSNSFADGDGTYNGVCEVCHTSTAHFMNDGTATDQNHSSIGGAAGLNCTGCHPHNSDFSPSGGACNSCHDGTPTYNSAVHVIHRDKYVCGTCHFGHGSGGTDEGTHPSGAIDIVFDPNGMATRNGQDSNTPAWSGSATKACSDIYCHSNGGSAYRGGDGVDTWSSTTSHTMTYINPPAWNSGINVSCGQTGSSVYMCHEGPSAAETAPGNQINDVDYVNLMMNGNKTDATWIPPVGEHRRGAHTGNDYTPSAYGAVQCFWCHSSDAALSTESKYEGTYGTDFHVDGETHFYPALYPTGTMVPDLNPNRTMAGGHCGASQSCW